MRPNSLFFDREQKKSLVYAVSMIVTIAFLVMIGYVLIRYRSFAYILRTELLTTPMFGLLLLIYVALGVACVFVIRWANCRVRRQPALWAIGIFLVAFIPRLLLFRSLSDPAALGTKAGWLGVNLTLLSVTLPDLALLALPSLSAVVVYLIARRFDDGSAPAAGLLFALYPAQIALGFSQPLEQSVALFALLSVLFALVAFSAERNARAMVFSALSGLSLAVCGIALASAWLVAVAYLAVWLVLLLASFKRKQETKRLILLALAFCAMFLSLSVLARITPVPVQLDGDLSGANAVGVAQQLREGDAMLDQLHWNTLKLGYNVPGSPIRLDQSVSHLWLEKDEALARMSGSGAVAAAGLSNLFSGIRLLDFFFLAGVYLFAWIGGLLRRRGGGGDLLLWILLLWVGAHLFSDRQAITRALGVPLLTIFAAYGVFALVGTEPRAKEIHKYDSCLNRGALNLGDIPPSGSGLPQTGAFHPRTGGALGACGNGVFGAMEAELSQKNNTDEQSGENII